MRISTSLHGGKIDDDTFSVVIQEFNNRRDVILLELEKWNVNL